MSGKLLLRRIHTPFTINCRRYGSETGSLLSLMGSMLNLKAEKRDLYAIQAGASRCYELGNSRNRYVCAGGSGPTNLDDSAIKVLDLIDFENRQRNKVTIEIFKCPKLLATKLAEAFPKCGFQQESLRIIQLSYHMYTDQNKGRRDCIIAANQMCKKFSEEGEFAFYSGAVNKNASDGLLFHNNLFFKTTNNEIHATVNSNNGYLNINNLKADDVGVIYTDKDFDIYKLRAWLEFIDE